MVIMRGREIGRDVRGGWRGKGREKMMMRKWKEGSNAWRKMERMDREEIYRGRKGRE